MGKFIVEMEKRCLVTYQVEADDASDAKYEAFDLAQCDDNSAVYRVRRVKARGATTRAGADTRQ